MTMAVKAETFQCSFIRKRKEKKNALLINNFFPFTHLLSKRQVPELKKKKKLQRSKNRKTEPMQLRRRVRPAGYRWFAC